MAGNNTSIYLSTEDRNWLKRNGPHRSKQLRFDLEELRRLYNLADNQPHIPIKEALDLVKKPTA